MADIPALKDDAAETCVYARKSAAAGSEIYYPGYVDITDNDQVRYSLSDTTEGSGDAALFRIDGLSGDLYTTAAHIYDNPSNGKFRITITAIDPSGQAGSIKVAITPSGGGSPPVVVGPSYIKYPENGTWSLAKYSATAANQGGGIRPIEGWIISVEPGGGDGDFFDIDDDGNLTFTQPPDYEDPADENGDNRYSFSLHVYDTNPPGGGRPVQTFFNVTVTVADETVEALEIDGPSAVRYAENGTGPVGTYSLLRANAAVDDWVLSGADADQFNIDDTTGELTFKRSPDYENSTDVAEENTYRVTITAYAGTQSKTEFVFVRVTDVNEPPTFDEGETATRSVEPDAELNFVINPKVEATDPDKNAGLTYSLEATPAPPFQIDQWTGQLSVSGAIDQNQASYTMTVFVTDGQNADGETDTTADDRITVTVNVAGGGNNAPEFPSTETGARSIAENTTTVENVGAPVIAEDDDNDSLTYTLGGTDASSFDFDDTDGQIKTKSGVTYDFETEPTYSVTVTADDSNGGTTTKAVTISLTNVEEAGTVTLSTYQPSARAQVTATLTDPDGITGTTTWQWAKTSDPSDLNTHPWANIAEATSSSYTPADEDVGSYLRATASYTDGHGPSKSAEATTTSAVQSGTNRPPDFGATTTTRDVEENTASGQPVGAAVTADDPDPNDSLTYSLEGTDANSFQFDSSSGQIQTKSGVNYDHETKPSYSVTVRVVDDNQVTDTIDVTIDVTNVDEPGTVALSMTHPSARIEITATLTDPDGGVTGESWQWAKADAQAGPYSDINGETSSTYTPADGYVGKFLKAKVSYDDDEDTGKTAEVVSANAVQAGANRPPTFSAGTVTLEVAENSGADVNVGSPVTATDLDTGNTLEYSLEGTDKDSFKIVSDSGQIQTKQDVTYDYETKASYSVTVKADDKNDGTATKAVTVTVTDVEEAGTVTLSMTQPSARTQLTATLTDPDGGVTGTTWVWARSDAQDGTYTDISGETSATYTPGDGDVDKFLQATASYEDRRGQGKTAAAVSENGVGSGENRAPDFSATTTNRSFPENTAAGENIGDPVEADDPDTSATLTYSLEGTDKDSFTIVPGTGQIQTKSGVTYNHEAKATHSVTVKVVDSKGGTDTIAVTINVTNVNEKPTFDDVSPTSRSIAENTGTGVDMGAPVAATDPDVGDTLTYTLGGTDASSFSIVALTGQLQTKASLDKEDKASYTVTVSVRDSKNDAGGADVAVDDEITVTITVTGENDPPEITGRSRVSYAENRTDAVANYNATDPEGVTTFTWSLSGDDEGDFSISNTGELTFQTPPDHEAPADADTNNIYLVTVRADDGNGATDTFGVTVTVADVNEPPLEPGKPTVLRASSNGVSVTWSAPNNTGRPPILRYLYQYKKNAEPGWSGATHATNGPITSVTIGELDAGTSYDVEVRAINDEGPGPWSAEGTGSTNNPPAFSGATAELEVPENTVVVTSIGTPVTATDTDSDTLTYTLEGTDKDSFQIVSTSGQIQTKLGMTYDHEAQPSYTVTVKADDGNGGTGTVDVTITVTDVNEAPAFDGPTTAREVPENTGADTEIGAPVAATDPDDGDSLTYSLGRTDANFFDIYTSTGQLKTKDALDHETKATYTVTVSVRDSKDDSGNPDTATDDDITVTITVTDANDAPEFPSTGSNARSIAENTVANTNIGAPVRATDADNDNLTYTLEGTDPGSFAIDESSGQLKTKSALDHEDKDSYTVTVKASDGKDGVDTIDVTITVSDVNEAPSFGSPTATRNVPENTAANQPVGEPVAAKDQDDGDSLAYSLGGTDSASFGINSSTGQITVGTGTTPDFETKLIYEVTVTAIDSSNLSDTITVTINVTEGNDPPVFATDTATRSVAENTGTGQDIGAPFEATDAEKETLTYTLGGTDAASFGIVATSGQLQTKAALDYEAKSSYSVTVKAQDTSSASGTINVTIVVTDVNEPPLAPGQPGVSGDSASSVSVTWTAPANDGRPAITGYDYQYKKTDEQSWSGATYAIPGDFTNLYITRLDSSTSYDVQARAKNDEGTGLWSATGAGSTGTPLRLFPTQP